MLIQYTRVICIQTEAKSVNDWENHLHIIEK